MGLSQALASAMAGLRANQVAMGLIASNVSNAETPGYVNKTASQVAVSAGEYGSTVRTTGINRVLDKFLQAQLRTEISGAAYADIRSQTLTQLQSMYGTPGGTGTMETSFNNLTSAFQALSASPDSASARQAVLTAAQSLAQQLNSMTSGIQALRSNAESGLADSTTTANNAMKQIASINAQLQQQSPNDATTAALLDQRDQYVNQLSQLMDINVINGDNNQVNIFTSSGLQLVGGSQASQLSFNAAGTVNATSKWDPDSSKSTLGTLSLTLPQGGSYDLIANKSIRSGKIAGLIELRDKTLVQAQDQLDQFAAALSSSLSDKQVAGTAATSGAQSGFDLDLAGLQNGNKISLEYTDTVTGTKKQVSIVRVDDPSALPLPNDANGNQVIGVDFSGGMASVVSQLNTALSGANISVSNPSGSILRVLDDGAGGLSDVNALSARTTVSGSNTTDPQVSLFEDGSKPYTGVIDGSGSQITGLAGRIAVNAGLLADPSKLLKINSSTAAADTTRPNFLSNQLTTAIQNFSASSGLGSSTSPYKGTLQNFLQQITSMQGAQANAAQALSDGQNVVLNSLQDKVSSTSGVNIDEEMAHLLALQNSYAANARVMSVVKEMYQALMQAM